MREMFKTLVGLSFFAGAVLYLCPEGSVRRVLKLLCTAILTAAVLSPLRTFDYDLLSLEEARFAVAETEISNRAELTGDRMKKLLMQDNCKNYILMQGQELGLNINKAVIEVRQDENGQWLPYAAEIDAVGLSAAAEELSRLLNSELGIPTERQVLTLHG